MSRAILTFLVAFCVLAGGNGATPEEVLCKDADNCLSLEEAKAAAYDVLNKAVGNGMKQINKIRDDGQRIRKGITENTIVLEMDKVVVRELTKISSDGNKAFEEALKAGKDLSVFECVVECELSARKQFPAKVDQCRGEIGSLETEPLERVDSTLQMATQIETNLKATQEVYVKKIRDSFSNVGVSWNREQALKAFAVILKGSENLSGNLSGILEKYEKSARSVVEKCEANFVKLTEEARECMKGCLER